MKNIFLISFALLFVSACNESNPTGGGDIPSCTAGGCTATGCASDCPCGCEGAGGDNCSCSTSCACSTTCAGGACSATGCASDCPCGCEGEGGDNCSCSTSCACGDADDNSDDESTTTNVVSLDGFAFSPSTLTISKGETVTWTLSIVHTVVSNDFTPVAGSLSTYSYQFDTAGTFGYKCGIHSTMTGTIIVTE